MLFTSMFRLHIQCPCNTHSTRLQRSAVFRCADLLVVLGVLVTLFNLCLSDVTLNYIRSARKAAGRLLLVVGSGITEGNRST